jgi:4-oxalocrotonate tautomerase
MSIISCDLREGRTEAQKRALASGIIAAVQAATGEPLSEMFFVIREGRGIDFVEAGEHLPDYSQGNIEDADLLEHLLQYVHHQQ